MTTEIVQYKCPSCGHLLGEEEYRHACEKNRLQIAEIVKEKTLQLFEQLKNEQSKEINRLKKQFEIEREKEVNTRVAKALNEEKVWMELKHKQDLAEKDKEIEASKLQQDEKIRVVSFRVVRKAIIDTELKHGQKEKQFEIQHSRMEADNKKLQEQVEKMQKTLDNIPPELQGTAGEFILIDELRKEFQRDDITPKKVGVAMSDVVQVIVTHTGERIKTPIVYDKKTGDKVSPSDIVKAKNYKTVHNTDHSIIVTEDIRNNRFTEIRDGVLLVHPVAVIDIAKRKRWFLIESSKQAKNSEQRDTKQAKLYEFFTSPEYCRDMQITIEAKSKLDDIQRTEEDYHRKVWNKRKELIEKWFQIDSKNNGIIVDITQDGQNTMDGNFPSF